MVSRGIVRSVGAPLVALFAVLLLGGGSVMAVDSACSVSVDPPAAVGGSVFTFSGSGFRPTQLLLQKGDGGPTVNDIDPGADPWTQTVQSRPGDEGTWTATFVEPEGCAIAVSFEVTLTSTDMIGDLLSDQPRTALPALFYLLVVGFGLAGGAFLSRRLGAARTGVRH